MLRVRRSRVVLVGSLAFSVVLAAVLIPSASAAPRSDAAAGASVLSESSSVSVTRNLVWIGWPSQSAPQAIRISSQSVGAPQPDEFQITYSNGTFRLDYEHQAGGPVTASYELTVKNIVELSALAEAGIVNQDSIAFTAPLGPAAFGLRPIQHSETTTENGTVVDSFLIASNSGDLTMNLTIAEGFVQLAGNKTLTPMEAKLTFDITHQMQNLGDLVALQLGIATSSSYQVKLQNRSWDDEYHFSEDNRAVNVSNDLVPGTSSAFFAWSNVATVNGRSGPVTATGPSENASALGFYDLYLAYPPASGSPPTVRIVHDPTLGVVSAAYLSQIGLPRTPSLPSLTADAALYVATVVGIVALVGATTLLVRRRSR